MLEDCTIEERWAGVNDLIERWLLERQDVIVQFCALSGVHELKNSSALPDERLHQFCQLLVDYLSAGHFEVYYELVREAEAFADGSVDIANALIPRIEVTTQLAMEFHDKYSADAPKATLSRLPAHLSKLGEVMASRFELEDQLIDTIHESHRSAVA